MLIVILIKLAHFYTEFGRKPPIYDDDKKSVIDQYLIYPRYEKDPVD